MECLVLIKFILFYQWLVDGIDGARILAVFPILAHSHFTYYEAIMSHLHSAGHEITFFSPFPATKPVQNFTMIDSRLQKSDNRSPCSRNFKNTYWLRWMYDTQEIHEKNCYDVAQLPEMKAILNSPKNKFDLLFLASNQMYECYLPIAEALDVPVIIASAFRWFQYADLAVGNPRNPSSLPFEFTYTPKKMTFFQRLENTFNQVALHAFYYFIERPMLNRFYQSHFPKFDLATSKKVSAVFFNSHPSIFSRPLVPNALEIAGIHVTPKPSPLPQKINNFIAGAKQGTILFTFGSITKSNVITPEMRSIFRDAFAAIPERVIWKFEEKIEGLSKNVMLVDWIPQRDVLAHPNVKAFITHCGLLGVEEAIYEAKPMVLIPFFVDQPGNAALLEGHGVGIYLDSQSLTKTKLVAAIRNVIDDKKYTENAELLSQRFKDRPMSAPETVVYWTEYVIRHDGAYHLRTVGADMPLYQYLLLDVIAFIVSIFLIAVYVIIFVLRKVYCWLCRPKKRLVKKKRE